MMCAGYNGGSAGGAYTFYNVTVSPFSSADCTLIGGLSYGFIFNNTSGERSVHCARSPSYFYNNTINILVHTSAGIFGPATIPGILPETESGRLQQDFTARLALLSQDTDGRLAAQESQITTLSAFVQSVNQTQLTSLASGSFCVFMKGSSCPSGFAAGSFLFNPTTDKNTKNCVHRAGDTGNNYFNVDGTPQTGVSTGCNYKTYTNLNLCCVGPAVSPLPAGS